MAFVIETKNYHMVLGEDDEGNDVVNIIKIASGDSVAVFGKDAHKLMACASAKNRQKLENMAGLHFDDVIEFTNRK